MYNLTLFVFCLKNVIILKQFSCKIAGSQSSLQDIDDTTALKEKNLTLEEENNLLKYKIELLLDMVNVLLFYSEIFYTNIFPTNCEY